MSDTRNARFNLPLQSLLDAIDYQIANPIHPEPKSQYILEGFTEAELRTVRLFVLSFDNPALAAPQTPAPQPMTLKEATRAALDEWFDDYRAGIAPGTPVDANGNDGGFDAEGAGIQAETMCEDAIHDWMVAHGFEAEDDEASPQLSIEG